MENLPIVYCESIYNRIPILGFNVGGAMEIVSSNLGTLIAPYQINTMKEELLKMLTNPSKPEWDITILDEYSWEKASEKYLKQII